VRRTLRPDHPRPERTRPRRIVGRRGRRVGLGLAQGLGLEPGPALAQVCREPLEPVGVEIGHRQGLRPERLQVLQVALDQGAVLGEPRAVAAERGERGQARGGRPLEAAAQQPLLDRGERGAAPDEAHDRIGGRPLGLVERPEPGVPAAPEPLEARPLGLGQELQEVALGRARRGRAGGAHPARLGLGRVGRGRVGAPGGGARGLDVESVGAEGGCGHRRLLGW
jgi:hypothetical protein